MCFMKEVYKSLIAMAVLLLMSACGGSVANIDNPFQGRPGTKSGDVRRQVTVATQSGGDYLDMLGNGDNFSLFGVENSCGYTFPKNKSDENGLIQKNWYNLDDSNTGEYARVLRFDDDETLRQHYNLEYDTIDWSSKTLLLAYGMRLYCDMPCSVRFEKKEEGKYLLTVEMISSIATALNWWRVAILVDKLDPGVSIEINNPDRRP